MKRLIFIILLITSSLLHAEYQVDVYENISESSYTNDGDMTFLQLMFMCAVLAAKYTDYSFKRIKARNCIIFKAANTDCSFVMKLNQKNHECHIYFSAYNDSFDYDRFKNIIDSLF